MVVQVKQWQTWHTQRHFSDYYGCRHWQWVRNSWWLYVCCLSEDVSEKSPVIALQKKNLLDIYSFLLCLQLLANALDIHPFWISCLPSTWIDMSYVTCFCLPYVIVGWYRYYIKKWWNVQYSCIKFSYGSDKFIYVPGCSKTLQVLFWWAFIRLDLLWVSQFQSGCMGTASISSLQSKS